MRIKTQIGNVPFICFEHSTSGISIRESHKLGSTLFLHFTYLYFVISLSMMRRNKSDNPVLTVTDMLTPCYLLQSWQALKV